LRPDRTSSIDGSIDQKLWNGRASLSATYFYRRLNEEIILDTSGAITPLTDPLGRSGGYRNTGGGLARGTEFSGSCSERNGKVAGTRGVVSLETCLGCCLRQRFAEERMVGRLKLASCACRRVASGHCRPAGVVDAVPLSLDQEHLYKSGTPISKLVTNGATYIPAAYNSDSTRAGRFFTGALRFELRPAERLGFAAEYQNVRTDRDYGDGPAGPGSQPAGDNLSCYEGRIQTANARIDYAPTRSQQIDAGYEYENEDFRNTLAPPPPVGSFYSDVSQSSHSIFAQDQTHLFSGRLQLAAGWRAQFFSLQTPEFQPAAGAPFAGRTFAAPPSAMRVGELDGILLGWTTLATRSLLDESSAVLDALDREDLPLARSRLARIVGRDTACLDESEIARAAVETLAESLCDGVIAPMLYLAIGGAPLATAFKAVNTLDSMIGHREPPYQYFGRIAARLDDAAVFIPARLAALAIVTAAGFIGYNPSRALSVWLRDGHRHPSPNAGRPEAAMAGALGVRLGGMNYYDGEPAPKPLLGSEGRPAARRDVRAAMRIVTAASVVAFASIWLCLRRKEICP
jgi:adenosylcobinamide-phosphate synthase